MSSTHAVLGVDGARVGWVGVRWDGTGSGPPGLTGFLAPSLTELCEKAGDVAVVAIDIPIGLSRDGRRACDDAVRPLLGPRRSSLFAPPAVAALDMPDYATANDWSKRHVGRGLSKQAWMLVPRIREARAFATTSPCPVHETFPELSFVAMNAGHPLGASKKTWSGLRTRLALLAAHGIDLHAAGVTDLGPAGAAGPDDVIDAAALAWSARRIATGAAERRPIGATTGDPVIWW